MLYDFPESLSCNGIFEAQPHVFQGGFQVYKNHYDTYLYFWPESKNWRIGNDSSSSISYLVAINDSLGCPTDMVFTTPEQKHMRDPQVLTIVQCNISNIQSLFGNKKVSLARNLPVLVAT